MLPGVWLYLDILFQPRVDYPSFSADFFTAAPPPKIDQTKRRALRQGSLSQPARVL